MNDIILKNLFHNKQYVRKVLPYLKTVYFDESSDKHVFKLVRDYIVKYRTMPSLPEMQQEMENIKANQHVFEEVRDKLQSISKQKIEENFDWLIDNTESWIQSQALAREIIKASEYVGKGEKHKVDPQSFHKALAIQFSTEIGIEFLDDEDIEGRWKKYNERVVKFPTGITKLDRVFSGGIEPKSLSVILAGTNVGKTAAKIALAANFLRNGYDVLYITLEMSEEKIAMRFDANFLNIPINDISDIEQDVYTREVKKLKKKTTGRLIIKEYAPTTINVNHLRALLDELEVKKGFKPQIIVVDYLNLMTSSRYSGENMYSTVKSIAEELRGLAVDKQLAVLSSTQGNRDANSSTTSDMDMTNTSESIGLPQTVDAMWAIIFPEEMRERNIQIWKVLKNRFGDVINYKIQVGVDFKTARMFDIGEDDSVKLYGQNRCTDKSKSSIIVEDDTKEIPFDI